MPKKTYNLGIICPSDFTCRIRGGAAGFVENCIDDFESKNVKIFGVTSNKKKIWKKIKIRENITFIPICKMEFPSLIPLRIKALFNYLFSYKRIIREDIDLLYIHMPECCLPFIYFKRIPFIYHQHGSANPVELSRFKYARNKIFILSFEIILKLIYRKADWIIAIDKLCYKKALTNGAYKKTSLIRNAINTKIFKPDKTLIKKALIDNNSIEKKFKILFVGRVAKTKGIDYLLKSLDNLIIQSLNFHLIIVGDGSYLDTAKKYIEKKNLNSYVTFKGLVDHTLLPYYYNFADILVLPSEMEGIPMVILESIACGTPVVATKVGGIPEIIKDGINGVLIDKLTNKSLATAIINASKINFIKTDIIKSATLYSNSEFMSRFNNIVKEIIK